MLLLRQFIAGDIFRLLRILSPRRLFRVWFWAQNLSTPEKCSDKRSGRRPHHWHARASSFCTRIKKEAAEAAAPEDEEEAGAAATAAADYIDSVDVISVAVAGWLLFMLLRRLPR